MHVSVNVSAVLVLRHSPLLWKEGITPAALEGSDVGATDVTTDRHERAWDTHAENRTRHTLTHREKETEREAIS